MSEMITMNFDDTIGSFTVYLFIYLLIYLFIH
jgi:hypothetical protein